LGRFDIIFETAPFKRLGSRGIEKIRGAPVTIAGLPDGAWISEIIFAGFHRDDGWLVFDDSGVADKHSGDVGVSEETKLGVLVAKTRTGIEIREDITPATGRVQSRMDDGKVADEAEHFEVPEPVFLFRVKLVTGPLDGVSLARG